MSTHTKTLIALAGMIGGVVVYENTTYGSEVAVMCFVLGVIQLALVVFEKRKTYAQRVDEDTKEGLMRSYFSIPQASGIFFIMVALLVLRMQFTTDPDIFVCETACEFRATITSAPKIKNEFQIFSVAPVGVHGVYDVQLKAPLYPRYEVGDELILTGKVAPPFSSMPHDGKKTFDYETYLHVHDIGSEMLYPNIVRATSSDMQVSYLTKLQHVRVSFIESISTYVTEPAASLASGMLFGANAMTDELTQTFRVAGISHIVVLSGFNIAILISFVLLVFRFVPLVLRIIFASTLVILFVLMVGGEASIIRATCMSFIGLLALLIGRAYVARQALLLSLMAIILYEPIHLLHDVSLHLSFLATAGIVYMSDGIKNKLHMIRSRTYKEIITTTLAAYLVTLPYVMYTFGTVSLYAFFTNLLVLPIVPVVMLLTFLVVVSASLSSTLGLMFGYLDTLLSTVIIVVARMIERLPLSSLSVSFSFSMMCSMYVLTICAYYYFVHRTIEKEKNETLLTKNNEILSEVISY